MLTCCSFCMKICRHCDNKLVIFSGIAWYYGDTFEGENFRRLLACAVPKDATPPNFAEKTFANSHKSVKFVKVLSLKFPAISAVASAYFQIVCMSLAVKI